MRPAVARGCPFDMAMPPKMMPSTPKSGGRKKKAMMPRMSEAVEKPEPVAAGVAAGQAALAPGYGGGVGAGAAGHCCGVGGVGAGHWGALGAAGAAGHCACAGAAGAAAIALPHDVQNLAD